VSEDLDAKSVITGHAVDANVRRVALADVPRGRAASVTTVVSRGRCADDEDRQNDRHVAATTSPRRRDPLSRRHRPPRRPGIRGEPLSPTRELVDRCTSSPEPYCDDERTDGGVETRPGAV